MAQTDDLDQADQAPAHELIPPAWARALYAGVFVIVLALLVIDVVGVSDWDIDNSAIALIAILAVLPLLDRIKSAKFGPEGAQVEMYQQLERRVRQVDYQTKQNAIRIVRATEPDDSTEAPQTPDEERVPVARDADGVSAASPVVPVERIVWVDDNPEGNDPYREELARRWEVETAVSTLEARARIAADPARTLAITDAARIEGGHMNREAGRELIAWLAKEHPDVPVVVFAGPATVRHYADAFRSPNVSALTADFGALFDAIRAVDRRRLVAAATSAVRRAGLELDPQPDGVDMLARRSDGRRIAIEVKAWERQPAAQLVEEAIDRLAELQRNAGAEQAVLVVRGPSHDVSSARSTGLAPEVHVVPVDELERWLQDGSGPPSADTT
jgi:DNA-binding NarL/FixJ family response regulator